jgi:hypothetical protein
MGKAVQQWIERDHQHLKGRLRGTRRLETLTGTRVLSQVHAFVRSLRGHCSDLGRLVGGTTASPVPPVLRAWDALTADLLEH